MSTILTSRPIPELFKEQLNLITADSLHESLVTQFNLHQVFVRLLDQNGKSAMTLDVGGDKLVPTVYRMHDGALQCRTLHLFQSNNGEGYLRHMEEYAKYAALRHLPVSISFAGNVEDSKPTDKENLSVFFSDLQKSYKGDFARLFPTFSVIYNDAVMGLIAGAIEAKKANAKIKNVLFVINGSGIGGALLQGSDISYVSLGHVPVIEQLNPFLQPHRCSSRENKFVCIENVAAGKAGIEDMWKQKTGERQNGEFISAELEKGNELAVQLYDNSALALAHSVVGTLRAHDLISQELEQTAIVLHGGVFYVPGYGARVKQIVEAHLGAAPQIIFTKDFTAHACSDGAAIAAFTKL
jgi:predicted NBD/HSP70 family sugar kinase